MFWFLGLIDEKLTTEIPGLTKNKKNTKKGIIVR